MNKIQKHWKYFSLNELVRSQVAKKHNIDNTPSDEIIEHLNELVTEILDPLREAWGSVIKVNSGFRCQELNKKLKGSKTSAHLDGYAADIVPEEGDIYEFFNFCTEFLKGKQFDQLIYEYSNGTSWVHIGLKDLKGNQRKQMFYIKS